MELRHYEEKANDEAEAHHAITQHSSVHTAARSAGLYAVREKQLRHGTCSSPGVHLNMFLHIANQVHTVLRNRL